MRLPHSKSRLLGLALASASLSTSCADDEVDIPDELVGKPYCTIVRGTWGYYEDGSKQYIVGPERSPAGCVCAPETERTSDETLARLNDAALEACLTAAARFDLVWDECQQDYEARDWLWIDGWLYGVSYAGEGANAATFLPPDLHCTED